MSVIASKRAPSTAARRAGYVVAVVINGAMLFAVNRWPGWDALPFLTDSTRLVLPLVNASIIVGLVVNLVYLVDDSPWLKALGDLTTTAVGLAAAVRVWQVFPFAFTSTFDWELVVRILLAVAIGGSIIGIVVQLVTLFRLAARGR